MAPVIRELDRHPDRFCQVVISTGQHREMLQQVLDVLEIRPQHDLAIMLHGQTLAQMTAKVLERLDPILEEINPGLLLAQGDTSTTFVASLAAFYRQIPVGHVEAGLRTDNPYDPFPEEINRRLTGALAELHFAPTERSVANLRREGIAPERIHLVGNTVIDALLEVADRPYQFEDASIEAATSSGLKVIAVTAHRRENWGEPMHRICESVKSLVERNRDVQVVFQMHKNPGVRNIITERLSELERILLVEPQEYVPWINLMKRSTLVLTDSGGIQEEAPALGKPVLVMRETTERPEGVEAGTSKLVGTDVAKIVSEAEQLLRDRGAYEAMSRAVNPYGDGHSAQKICGIIDQWQQARSN